MNKKSNKFAGKNAKNCSIHLTQTPACHLRFSKLFKNFLAQILRKLQNINGGTAKNSGFEIMNIKKISNYTFQNYLILSYRPKNKGDVNF